MPRPSWQALEPLEERRLLSTIRFAAIGDYGSAGTPEANVATLVKSWSPQFIITVGDNNYSDGLASTIDANIGQYYHEFIGSYTGTYGAGSATNQFFPALGNHDWNTTSGSPAVPTPYLNYFTLPGIERYYTFAQGPVQFFVIDSDSREPDGITSGSIQGQWLQSQLAASTAEWKVVYFHHSPYSTAQHGSNTTLQWPFKQWGADVVLTGHDHSYERLVVSDFPYFVNGLGGRSIYAFNTPVAGSQFRYNADYGAMLIDADDAMMRFQFFTRTGVLIDTHTLIAAGAMPVVTIAATTPGAVEAGGIPGQFTVTRTGDTSLLLTVTLQIAGTAINGTDYATLPASVVIPQGASSITLNVAPVADGLTETAESVLVTLPPSSLYNRSAADRATVTITDSNSTLSTLVAMGAAWKYLDNGSNQGTAWRAAGFNDASWASGPAQLGYGDGDEATVVGFGSNASNKFITTYFRKTFTVANPATFLDLTLTLLRDDGAVVYLNGTEIVRSNMPTGTITSSTLSSTSITGAGEGTVHSFTVNPSLLLAGNNTLAVEIHQDSAGSSDISFDLGFSGQTVLPPAPPQMILAAADVAGRIDLTWNDLSGNETGFRVERSGDGVNFAVLATIPPGSTTYSDATIALDSDYVYRVAAFNVAGQGVSAAMQVHSLPLPAISVDDQFAPEDTPDGALTFMVTLSHAAAFPVTVRARALGGTALGGVDFLELDEIVSFDPGDELSHPVRVVVLPDSLHEDDETILLQLTEPTNGTLADAMGQGVIVNDDPLDAVAPRVVQVFVASSQWTASFLDHLRSTGMGDGGFAVPAGVAQLGALGWVAMDQIQLRFSEPVTVRQEDLQVHGVRTADLPVAGFVLDALALAATWTLAGAMTVDKLRISLGDTVTDLAGNALDGEWVDAVGNFPSGDGAAGGAFRFRFNVVPADIDFNGSVQATDLIQVRNAQFQQPGTSGYAATLDINGDGRVSSNDLILTRNLQFTRLPDGEPGGAATMTPLASFAAVPLLTLEAPIGFSGDNLAIETASWQHAADMPVVAVSLQPARKDILRFGAANQAPAFHSDREAPAHAPVEGWWKRARRRRL